MKILWLTFIPSPYRCKFFEKLGEKYDLTVVFERANSVVRGNNWANFKFNGYKGKILPGITIGGNDKFCPGVVKYLLDKSFDKIIVSNPTSPTGIFAVLVLKVFRRKYMVESDGAFPSGSGGIRAKIKKFVMADADICFSTADTHDEYYMESGVKKENLRRYPFTSFGEDDTKKARELAEKFTKEELKKKLGMTEEKVILSVGRFTYENGYGKGFDVLLNISKSFADTTGIYIVGDEPTKEFIERKEKEKLDNVHFIGFKTPTELADYYIASDLFVLLTRGDVWGLVINESMMYGLPVITTDKCVAGVELIKSDKNGYIVSVENEEDIIEKINCILKDRELSENMTRNNIETIRNYTFEKMVEAHIRVFEENN
jgi:glycosyltransferase involved in cell wall biosynthesis